LLHLVCDCLEGSASKSSADITLVGNSEQALLLISTLSELTVSSVKTLCTDSKELFNENNYVNSAELAECESNNYEDMLHSLLLMLRVLSALLALPKRHDHLRSIIAPMLIPALLVCLSERPKVNISTGNPTASATTVDTNRGHLFNSDNIDADNEERLELVICALQCVGNLCYG
jgi:hypothetical protein